MLSAAKSIEDLAIRNRFKTNNVNPKPDNYL